MLRGLPGPSVEKKFVLDGSTRGAHIIASRVIAMDPFRPQQYHPLKESLRLRKFGIEKTGLSQGSKRSHRRDKPGLLLGEIRHPRKFHDLLFFGF
jgi:hypothetical protein